MMETMCSWVSSQYASNMAVKSCTWCSSVVEGLTGSLSWDSGGGGGGWVDDCSTSPWVLAGIPNLD